jgi:hypothetical protein
VSDQAGPGSGNAADAGSDQAEANPKNGFVAQVIANTSLLTALVVYMGWAYENALLGYFRLSPIALNLDFLDYALKGLVFFLNTNIIFIAVGLVFIVAIGSWAVTLRKPALRGDSPAISRVSKDRLLFGFGFLITITAVPLAWFGLHGTVLANWFSSNLDVFYLVVVLVGAGPLLLTWPTRFHGYGHFLYPLAIVAAAACALWAAGLYASNLGTMEAENFARNLSTQTSVGLYSVQPLAVSGYGVKVQPVRGSLYHYYYSGLRLLYVQSGTYYLLPLDWSRQRGHIYIFIDNDQIRIEFF